MRSSNFLGVYGHTAIDVIYNSTEFPSPNTCVEMRGRTEYFGGTGANIAIMASALDVKTALAAHRGHLPSVALLKATLVNSTRWLGGADAVADFGVPPNYHQGFGCVHQPDAVPHPGAPFFGLEFFDNWQDPASHFTASGARKRFRINLAAGGELRLCLAYTDTPGRALPNNLNLLLEVPGTNLKRFGNEHVPRGFNGPDPTNNVEVLRISGAPAGSYLVQIDTQSRAAEELSRLRKEGAVVN